MQHTPSPPPVRRHFRQTRDRLATALITAGGIGVIAAVMAIGVFLAVEVVPLFWSSSDAPRINLETLWLPQAYEGHEVPVHRWQPAMPEGGGEPRFGMLPLVWGTLEAAIWH